MTTTSETDLPVSVDQIRLRLEQGGARLILAEDDPTLRDLVVRTFVREGYQVCDVDSGAALLEVLESVRVDQWPLDGVDLLLLDVRMPGLDGLEALRRLRAARWTTPAIVMTAFPSSELRREAERLGAPILAKPFSLDALSRSVLSVLTMEVVRRERREQLRAKVDR